VAKKKGKGAGAREAFTAAELDALRDATGATAASREALDAIVKRAAAAGGGGGGGSPGPGAAAAEGGPSGAVSHTLPDGNVITGRGGIENGSCTNVASANRVRASEARAFTLEASHAGWSDLGSSASLQ